MSGHFKYILIAIGLATTWHLNPCAAAPNDPIGFFADLRELNTRRLVEIDKSIDQKVVQSNSMDSLSHFETEIVSLQNQRTEYQYRQDFLNRIILQFDAKFRGGDVQSFLSMVLKEMAQVAAKSDDSSKILWKFLNNMAISIGALPKGQTDVLKFVEGYMNMGSVKDPVDPAQFLSQLDYYNGAHAQKANGMTPAEAAESLEQ